MLKLKKLEGRLMQELYQQVIGQVRSPERTQAYMSLIEILLDTNYADDLTAIEGLIATGQTQEATALAAESYIGKCTKSLLNKMGLSVLDEFIYKSPARVAEIIDTILDSVDHFDDYDTMLQIMQHNLNYVEAIGCLVGFVNGTQEHLYIELIDDVAKSTVDTLVSILTARAVVDLDINTEIDLDLAAQVTLFIKTYPTAIITPYLLENEYLEKSTKIIDVVMSHNLLQKIDDYIYTLTGILFTHHKTFDDAYEHLEELVEYIIGDNEVINVTQIRAKTSDMLDKLYKMMESIDE